MFCGVAEGFAGGAELGAGAAFELGVELLEALAVVAEEAGGVAALEGFAEFVEALGAFAEDAGGLAAVEVLAGVLEFFAAPVEALAGEALEAGVVFGEGVGGVDGGLGDLFGGGAGCGGAKVGNKIANRKIDFMPDCRDDRDGGLKDRASDHFFVEGPKVFEAAAAAD